MVPNIPFQMLLRGANAVGYTSYPDNAVSNPLTVFLRIQLPGYNPPPHAAGHQYALLQSMS